MHIGSHEYANEADDNDDVPKPVQSLGTPVPRQKHLAKLITSAGPLQGVTAIINSQHIHT